MKTAIIKTTFWDEESFEKLSIDSKMLYFYLLANPTRTLHKIIKLNDKICSAHTGISIEQIQIAKEGLVKNNLVVFKDRYYMLIQDFVEAKKGRFTQNVIDREDKEIPEDVKNYLYSYTGTIPVYKDKDKDKDNNKDIIEKNKKEKEKENELIVKVIEKFYEIDKQNKRHYGNVTQRKAALFLIQEYGFDNTIKMIDFLIENSTKIFNCPTTPLKLSENWQRVVNEVKFKIKQKQEKVTEVI